MTVIPSRGGWSRPYVVTLLVTLLLGCASACAADPTAEQAEALRVAAEDYFAAQDLVVASSGKVKERPSNVVVTISLAPETSAEEALTLINDAQVDLADEMAVAIVTGLQVVVEWTVQGTPLNWPTTLDPRLDRDKDRLALDFAVSRTGPTVEKIDISSRNVEVYRGEHDQFPPETVDTSAPAELPPGVSYSQFLTVHGWLLQISLDSGEDLSAVPLAEVTACEAQSDSGRRGYIDVSAVEQHVSLRVHGMSGGLESSSTTSILRVMDSCTGVADRLVLSSFTEEDLGVMAYACSQGSLTPDADYYNPNNNLPLADRMLQEARSGQ